MRGLLTLVVVSCTLGGGPAASQVSPLLPLDDPRLALIEHLILRGDVRDPSTMLRPFRRVDAVRALAEADLDSAAPVGRTGAALADALADRPEEAWWRVAARGGLQAVSRARRDLLHPAGRGGVFPYADATFEGRFGPITAASRAAFENRLRYDPDYPGQDLVAPKRGAYRFIEAYGAAQFRWVRVQAGQVDRNWGPVGLPGLALSDYGYPRTDIEVQLGGRSLSFTALTAQLGSDTTATGERVMRYFVAHRLAVRVGALHLALWETAVVAGESRRLEWALRNPLTLLIFADQFGQRPSRNAMLGGEVAWRVTGGLLLEGQAAIDDWTFDDQNPYPNRWAFTVGAGGRLGGTASWRARYTTATTLAFRTASPFESFTDQAVGLGRGFADNEQLVATLGVVPLTTWLFTSEFAVLRQGEGRLTDPWPTAEAAASLPTRLSGIVETTYRVGFGVAGWSGPLTVTASGGLHRTVNANHVPGARRTRLEGRMIATLGLATGGAVR